MSQQKINWLEIKQKYFESEIEEVRKFIKLHISYISDSYSERTIATKTKGWRNEKQEFRKKIAEKTQEKIIDNVDVQKSTELLIQGKLLIIDSIISRVRDNNKNLTMNELAIAFDKIKIELGEPIKIDKIQGDKDNPFFISEIIID